MRKSLGLFCLGLTLLGAALTPLSAHAQYAITRIADSTTVTPVGGTFRAVDFNVVSLSGSTVVFRGSYSGGTGTQGIFANAGSGGALNAIATNGGTQSPRGGTFIGFDLGPGISGSTVVFRGAYSGGTGTQGIFSTTTTGGAFNTVITDEPGTGTFTSFSSVSISGTNVAFRRNDSGGTGTQAILANTGAGGALTTIISDADAAPGGGTFIAFGDPRISESNIAFWSKYTGGTGTQAIFANTGVVGALTTIVTNADTTPSGGTFNELTVYSPSISGNSVAFWGAYTGGTGTQGIFANTGVGGALTTIVTDTDAAPGLGTFTSVGNPIFSGGKIAFSANYSGGTGFFFSAGGSITPIVTTNTPSPFGSPFTGFTGFSVDGDNIAFSYRLADGRRGIAVAVSTTPEPGTLAFLMVGGTLVVARRRRK